MFNSLVQPLMLFVNLKLISRHYFFFFFFLLKRWWKFLSSVRPQKIGVFSVTLSNTQTTTLNLSCLKYQIGRHGEAWGLGSLSMPERLTIGMKWMYVWFSTSLTFLKCRCRPNYIALKSFSFLSVSPEARYLKSNSSKGVTICLQYSTHKIPQSLGCSQLRYLLSFSRVSFRSACIYSKAMERCTSEGK